MESAAIKRASERAEKRWGGGSGARQSGGVDRLVATYALQGRNRRREQRKLLLKRMGAGLGLAVLVGLLIVAGGLQVPDPAGQAERVEMRDQLASAQALRAQLTAEIDAVGLQRDTLAVQREALAADLEAINGQQLDIRSRREDLDQELAAMDAERARLEAERQAVAEEAPQLAAEIARIDVQREELRMQQRQFESQTDDLAVEIDYLGRQRVTLEEQRRDLESQWTELQDLMDKMRKAQAPETSQVPAPAVEAPALSGPATSLPAEPQMPVLFEGSLAALSDAELGEARGAISFGEDLSISIGLTRTANVNGVETYSSALQIDDLGSVGLDALNGANTLLIQNGAGNMVDPAVLDSLSSGVSTIIQNTLDGQYIQTTNMFDIEVGNVSRSITDMQTLDTINDSLSFQY